ncbi:hypothetical protein [Bradyrhizobium sp. CCBAU 53421]|uniref:hypothetical protein n=1 Tax=Bradyrhizobium sp. CCBAU 53421 TaxID=1325120 RepID=UPI00188B41E2|nr:hypothetical protein [Bradyrhizobium sp. CCBAU 53421]
MNDPTVEDAFDRDDLTSGHHAGTFPARAEVDQRPTAAVVDDELVAENFDDAASHRRRTSRLQCIDGGRLQQHDAPRLPILGESRATGTGGGADGEHGERDARQQTSTPR